MSKNPKDPRGGHVRIYWVLIDSVAWRALGYPSQALYTLLRRRLQSTNNGNISATLGDLKHYGWSSSATLARALRELVALGFLAVTRQGGIAYGRQVCTLYRFTDEQVFDQPKFGIKATPATNEWKQFANVAACHVAIESAHAAVKRNPVENTSGLQKVKRTGSLNEALRPFNDSASEAVAISLVQKMKQSRTAETVWSPHEH